MPNYSEFLYYLLHYLPHHFKCFHLKHLIQFPISNLAVYYFLIYLPIISDISINCNFSPTQQNKFQTTLFFKFYFHIFLLEIFWNTLTTYENCSLTDKNRNISFDLICFITSYNSETSNRFTATQFFPMSIIISKK